MNTNLNTNQNIPTENENGGNLNNLNNSSNLNNTNNTKNSRWKTHAATAALALLLGVLCVLSTDKSRALASIWEITAMSLLANLIAVRRTPAAAYISVILSCGVAAYLTKDILTGIIPPLTVCAVGSAVGICIRKKLTFIKSAAVGAAAFLAVSFVPFFISVYINYGSLIEGTGAFFSEMFDDISAQLKEYLDGYGEVSVQYASIREMMSYMGMMIPGIAVLAAETVGAAAYTGSYYISRMRRRNIREYYPNGFYSPLSAEFSVFFIVCAILTFALSSFETSGAPTVFECALTNVCLMLTAPTVFSGIYIMIRKAREPRIVIQTETGQTIAPMRFSALWILVPLVIVNFTLAVMFAAFYGAVCSAAEDIKRRRKDAEK